MDEVTTQRVFPEVVLTNSFGEGKPLTEIFREGAGSWHDNRAEGSELKASLVVFYPFSFSPVCSNELDALNEDGRRFADAGVQVVVVCCDSIYTLRAFREYKGYEFELLSDFWPHGHLSRKVGAFDEEKGISTRHSFLVDRKARILKVVSSELSAPRDINEYFASLNLIV